MAARALMGHLLVRGFSGAERTAFRAIATVLLDDRLEPLRRGFLGREHVHQLKDSHPLTVRFAGCFLRHFRSPLLPLE